MPLIIAMLMLVACYTGLSGNSLGLKQTLTDSMLECNLREPLPGKEQALVVPEHSAIVAAHEQAQFEMSAEDIKSPSFGKKFASRTPERPTRKPAHLAAQRMQSCSFPFTEMGSSWILLPC